MCAGWSGVETLEVDLRGALTKGVETGNTNKQRRAAERETRRDGMQSESETER